MTTPQYTIRPLGAWVGPETPEPDRRGSHLFKATWQSTLLLLGRELRSLDAERVVLQLDVREAHIRVDGMLRADAKVGHRGVRLSFESKHGPLTYATDVYERRGWGPLQAWQANVRAIALAFEALRSVDRHGVSRTGEQYRGWRAIEAGPSPSTAVFATPEHAARWMADTAADLGRGEQASTSLIANRGQLHSTYAFLARKLHPDAGGDPLDWARLDEARRLLDPPR